MKIYIALYDKTENLSEVDIKDFGKACKKKLEETKNEDLYKERVATYILAKSVINELQNKECELSFDENGKPYISGADIDISLSHTDGLSTLIVSEKSVGIDAELISEEKEEKIIPLLKRYCEGFDPKRLSYDIPINIYSIKSVGESLVLIPDERAKINREQTGTFLRWTELEAALKLSGKGFMGLCETKRLSSEIEVFSYVISCENKRYALSAAKK